MHSKFPMIYLYNFVKAHPRTIIIFGEHFSHAKSLFRESKEKNDFFFFPLKCNYGRIPKNFKKTCKSAQELYFSFPSIETRAHHRGCGVIFHSNDWYITLGIIPHE